MLRQKLWPWAKKRSEAIRADLADFTRDTRVLLLAAMALVIGAMSALVAYALVWLIGLITNLAYYQRLSAAFISPAGTRLGYLAILVPCICIRPGRGRHLLAHDGPGLRLRGPLQQTADPQELVGYLGRAEVIAARMRIFTEERKRERLLAWNWPHERSKGGEAG